MNTDIGVILTESESTLPANFIEAHNDTSTQLFQVIPKDNVISNTIEHKNIVV